MMPRNDIAAVAMMTGIRIHHALPARQGPDRVVGRGPNGSKRREANGGTLSEGQPSLTGVAVILNAIC